MKVENGVLIKVTDTDILEDGSFVVPEGVKEIGDSAFSGCTSLSSINIPESVTSIGAYVFQHCISLSSIDIPESVTSIGMRAFFNCSSLSSINIPSSVTSIGISAFSGCTSLSSIDIPESVTGIGSFAFRECTSLSSIDIPESVTGIWSSAFRECTSLSSINIPESVTSIEDESFYRCTSLSSIDIPESVTSIGSSAFRECTSLSSINIPESVISIEALAFYECTSLSSINIPESVTSIGENAFGECTSLSSIEIPESVTSIGDYAFTGCTSLSSINIPERVTSIGDYAFFECTSLSSINIPESVTTIGEDAFSGCTSLSSINIPESVTSIGSSAFSGCTSLSSINIPERVTSIGDYAFTGCTSLSNINIPESVTSIGDESFAGCTSLSNINIPESVTSIGDESFAGCTSLRRINIPESVTEIGNGAFFGCENLESVIYNSDLISGRMLVQADIPVQIILEEYADRIKKVKEKNSFFKSSPDYGEKDMNIFYYEMINSIGIDEVERMTQFPNLTEEEVKQYALEKEEAFKELYETKYAVKGDLGVSLEVLKYLTVNFGKKKTDEKNNLEMKLFKQINEKLEDGYDGNLTELLSGSLEELGIEVTDEVIRKVSEFEKSINKSLINERLEKIAPKIEESLQKTSEKYPNPIVLMQLEPIRAMVEDVVREVFSENGKLDLDVLRVEIGTKMENANAPYINQNKDQIVDSVMELFASENVEKMLNSSVIDSVKKVKENVGTGWKFKINKALAQIGYSFDSLPHELSEEEVEKLGELLNFEEVEKEGVSVPKKGIEREKAYELLASKNLPKVVTYQQIHDMFGSVHEPYSEEFKKFFKEHREEFLYNPEMYSKFGTIHNNFEMIINSPQLKNLYEHGKLTVEQIVAYLGEIEFVNTREGNEELARLASSIGEIVTEEQFEFVQDIFEITKRRERTSIPPMQVTKSKFRGRMLSPDDVLNLFAGNITTCCQRFGDVGEGAMLLGSIEENAGIFVIEELDAEGNVKNIIGQSLTIRQKGKDGNNDRLTFDNIEIDDKVLENLTTEEHAEILAIYQEAGKQAIEKDKKFLGKLLNKGQITGEQYDSLVLKEVIAGTGYNNLEGLHSLPNAEIVVPAEGWNKYKTVDGGTQNPWIDSAGGKTPEGSPGKSKVIAIMDEKELAEINARNSKGFEKTKLSDVPLWYGKVGQVQNFSRDEIGEDVIEKVKLVERIAYRDAQQIMNDNDIEDVYDLEDIFEIENAIISLGSNDDWYVIYGEDEDSVTISDLAVVGGINARNNGEIPKSNTKLAIAEATTELYSILIEAESKGKSIFCNATADTSLMNIKRLIEKGMARIKDMEGNEIQYANKKLVYEDGSEVQTRDWDDDGEIQMLDLEIIPEIEKIKEAKKEVEKFLEKVQDAARMAGAEKEEGLDELRNEERGAYTDDER